MSSTKRLFENITSLYVLQGANYLLPLVVLPYLVRILGAEKFGLIAFAQALMQYFVLFTDYGFNLTATKKIAASKNNQEEISKTCSNALAIKLGLLVICFVLLLVIVFGFSKFRRDWAVYLVSYILVIGYALFPIWFFQGIEQMRTITILNLIGKSIATLGIFVLVKNKDDFVLAAFLQALGFGVIGVLGLAAMFYMGKISLKRPTAQDIKEEMTEGWHVFISTAAVSLYTASNAFLLGIFSNNTAVGYFSAGDKVIKAANGLISPVFQSIYPHVNTLFARSQIEAKLFLQKITKTIGLGTLFLSIGTYFLAPLIIHTLFGKDFQPAVEVVRCMAFLPFVIAINNIFGMQTMITFGLNRALSRILISAGIFNLILIIPLIHYYNAKGASISVTLTEILVSILMITTLKTHNLFFYFQNFGNEESVIL